jgi:hypothetical protein
MKHRDIAGQKFNRLTIIRHMGTNNLRQAVWLANCDCGNSIEVTTATVTYGHVKSCGCAKRDAVSKNAIKHNKRRTREYTTWCLMKARCNNPKNPAYPSYGGRGIKVCDRWQSSFENFLADMGEKPSSNYSIDRIDNDGNYEPDNCRWATSSQQFANTRRSRHIEYKGESLTLNEWARKQGINPNTLRARIEAGWNLKKALNF